MNVKINDNPEEYRFILDTGAMTMIDERIAKKVQLEKENPMPTMDPSVKIYLTTLKELRVGGMKVENMSIPVTNIQALFGESFEMDGFIGSDFLKHFRLTIDYKEKAVITYDTIHDSLYKGYRIPFNRHFMNGAPLIECRINGEIEIKGMIDTGSPFGLVFPLSLVEQIDGQTKIRSKGVIAKWPFTSSDYNCLSRIERLTLGSLVLQNVIALCAELPANMSYPLIGKEFLSQFLVTLDYPDNEIILSPCDDVALQDNLFSTGLSLKKDGRERTVVQGFWEGSPADKAGIGLGDEILKINSKQTKDLSIEVIREMLRDDTIPKMTIEVKSEETVRDMILEKEMLLPD